MAARATPGTAWAARACVSLIFPPPISPMYTATIYAESNADMANYVNIPLRNLKVPPSGD
jgi:hypothetical protein